ncbi:MAG: LacI family DNA-binding transcriptional regulator [Opitutaceae bacterium]|jgi:LacI family transcriptional regulator
MKNGRVSLNDVAKKAGLSRAAVSYALRDDPNSAVETRELVRKIATELGYRPDPVLAKVMMHLHAGREGRYAGKLAFLNVHENREYWRTTTALNDFQRSAERRAAELGYGTEAFWLHEPGRTPRRLAQMLTARGIRGVVIGSTGRHGSVLEFPLAKFASVAVGYSIETPALHRVVTHHYRNTRLALRKVIDAGYERIGFIAGRDSEAAMEDLHLAAFLAYQQTLKKARRVTPLLYDGQTAAEIRRWFSTCRPDVILSTSAGVDELAEAGVRVPDDAALVKLLLWDKTEGAAGVMPGYERLGAAAIDLLAGQLQHDDYGVPEDPKIMQVEGRWCDGASLPVRSSVSGA